MSAVEAFDAVDLIRTKRDGGELSTAQIDWLIDAYTRGYVADEQMSAMTMAIFLNGMSRARDPRPDAGDDRVAASAWTSRASASRRPTSTRPAASATRSRCRSMPLVAIVRRRRAAALGPRPRPHRRHARQARVDPRLARRAHATRRCSRSSRDVGGVICAAGSGLAPADGKLYALRDITGTVEAIPLIASSIMSKKIAEGTGALVLDVKFGSGAFLQDIERSRELARTMVELGEDAGVATSALLTNMNVPLGLAIGNANEVRESVEVLAGGGPADVVELTVALAREMLALAGRAPTPTSRPRSTTAAPWTPGARDPRPGRRPRCARCPSRARQHVVTADRDGVLVEQEALPFGIAAWRLGAGRARKEDPVHHAAGIDLHAKPGDTVRAGAAAVHAARRRARALRARARGGRGRVPHRRRGRRVEDGGPLIADRIGR